MSIQLPCRVLSTPSADRSSVTNFYQYSRLARTNPKAITHRDLRILVPLLEALELLQPEERAELVHRAHAPLPRLGHAENLDEAEHGGRAARTVRPRALVRRVLQDTCDVVVGEAAVGPALDVTERTRARVLVHAADGRDNCPEELGEAELIEWLSGALERVREELLRPDDVLFGGGGVPLKLRSENDNTRACLCTYAVHNIELHRALVAVAATNFHTVGVLERLL